MIELKIITTTFDNNGVSRGVFGLSSVPICRMKFIYIFSSIVVLTPNGNF